MLYLKHCVCLSRKLCINKRRGQCGAHLYLCEGEGGDFRGDSQPYDGPAIAVGHMKLVQPRLYLVEGVVQGV